MLSDDFSNSQIGALIPSTHGSRPTQSATTHAIDDEQRQKFGPEYREKVLRVHNNIYSFLRPRIGAKPQETKPNMEGSVMLQDLLPIPYRNR